MATEDIHVENGRLTVERPVAHKDNIDVDLTTVEQVYFERSLDPNADGALVLHTRDGESHLIRVANEDTDAVLGQVYDAWRGSRKDAVADAPDLFSTMDAPETGEGNREAPSEG